ncbi:MAG TPA: ABC transporter substrate-binding protein, partial [Verrucomicrobiae bacterium]|nr:ABC transporter substrate-binding protein [Verrucomicrobiae bacterium]
MKTYRIFRVMAIGLTMAGMICGCGKNEELSAPKPSAKIPLPDPPLVATCEPGTYGGRLVMAEIGDPKSFNPITANEMSSIDIIRSMFAGLVSFDWPSQEVTPGLAASWSVAPDKKTWTFNLRHGLLWSDGQPLTADDVVFTWDVIYNPDIINVTVDQFRIHGKNFQVTKVDDYTVQVITPEIYAPFLEAFGGVPIIPKHKLEKAVAEKRFSAAYGIDARPEDIVGCGPFRLREFKPAQFTLLERNPYFCEVDKKGQRLPYLDNVIYTVAPNMNTISLRFLRGECDVNERVGPDEYDHYKEEAGKGHFQFFDLGVGPETLFFWFNENTGSDPKSGKPYVDAKKLKWFRNQKFRQAVAYGIDRQSIVNAIYAGRAKPNYGFITAANPKWQNTNVMTYPYDLDKAHALLADIGIKDRDAEGYLKDADGNTIEFVFNTNTGNDIRGKT